MSRAIVVPGAFGDGAAYNGLRNALAASGVAVETKTWGLPKALFVGNFSSKNVHDKAEQELADAIDAAIETGPGPLHLVGHSAGCGVILGALARSRHSVANVVLIAPSVSPTYDLKPALAKAAKIDVFYSDRDTTFLKWRCETFGGYDRVKTPAAGFSGFATADKRLTQHAYDPAWEKLGNDGGHGGGTSERFVKTIVMPCLVPSPGTPGEG